MTDKALLILMIVGGMLVFAAMGYIPTCQSAADTFCMDRNDVVPHD